MGLTSDLISQFVRATNDKSSSKKESTVYGTAIKYGDKMFVKIDGSDLLTPFTTTVDIENNERVMVTIKNHKATITGNITSPAARSANVKEIGESILNIGTLIANKVDTEDFEAEKARIDTIQADNVTIKESLSASEAEINTIKTDNVTIKERLTTNETNIASIQSEIGDIETVLSSIAEVE